jgi:hypothetical protein
MAWIEEWQAEATAHRMAILVVLSATHCKRSFAGCARQTLDSLFVMLLDAECFLMDCYCGFRATLQVATFKSRLSSYEDASHRPSHCDSLDCML